MGICNRLMSLYRREEAPEDKRGKACLANGELYAIKYTPNLRVRDVCIEIAKQLDIAPVALDFFTLMTTDCEHCLRPNRQIKQQCDKQNDHYFNPKRVLYTDDIASKVFFFRFAFKVVQGQDLKLVNKGAYEYFLMQCRWDYINGRISNLSRKDHLTLLVLESIIRGHEQGVSCKEILDNPKRYGLAHMFFDDVFSPREIRSHLKRQLQHFKTAQNNVDKAKNLFLFQLESVTDFGVTKIVVKKFYYQSATDDVVYPVEWEILISANGLRKRRTYKDERVDGADQDTTSDNRVDEMVSDYKDIEYIEITQSQSDEIIHISRQKGFLEVISVKSASKKESLITLIEGFYHLLVNRYKTLTKYKPGLEFSKSRNQSQKLQIHGPIVRKKVEALLKAVETENGDRNGVHMIRRNREAFNSYNLSFIYGSEVKHFEIICENDKYGLVNAQKFSNLTEMLEHYKAERRNFPTKLTKYCPIPREGLCALYDDQIVVEAPCPPSSAPPANPEYPFEYIGNLQLETLHHTFTGGDFGDKVFKARWLKGDKGGYEEVFCRRLEPSRAANFREKVVKCGENMRSLVHRNLVQFHGVCFADDQNTLLTFEWIPAGTLDDYLKKETEVTVETIITFAAQVAEACMFLHSKNYVHGWLAAHNVLIVTDEIVKLSDVSVPCLREEDMLSETLNINRSPWKARECFQGRRYSKESDVWAFGVVLWEMFSKTKPFQNMTDDMILQVFQQDRHLACPKWCPEEVGKIMKSCWITEPSKRPTFQQIVEKLRQITGKLTPQERERKIPETIDEKFAIEPLIINKPSPTALDDGLLNTSFCSNNHDNSDGTLKDCGSNDGSFMTSMSDESQLDLIPEKESRDMVWTPEEIEMKNLQRNLLKKSPAIVEQATDVTYDRINQTDYFNETVDPTELLTSEHGNFAVAERHELAITTNELQTAIDDPRKRQERPTDDNPMSTEDAPDTYDTLGIQFENRPGSTEVPGRDYARLPTQSAEDDPPDDEECEEKPLIEKEKLPPQTDSIFHSFKALDHIGFLASQLGTECTLMDKDSIFVDNDSTFMDDGSTLMDNDGAGAPEDNEVLSFLTENLDPFAADSEAKAMGMFSKYEESTGKRSESQYVSNAKYSADFKNSGRSSGYLNPAVGNPVLTQQSSNFPYVMAEPRPVLSKDPSSSNVRTARSSGYVSTPSRARTQLPDHTKIATGIADSAGNPAPVSFSGMVEFSKLDPFAMGGECMRNDGEVELPSTLREGSTCPHAVSTQTRSGVPEQAELCPTQSGQLFSSFSDRDPMSELSASNMQVPASSRQTKPSISASVDNTNSTYVSRSSLRSASHNPTPGVGLSDPTSGLPKPPQHRGRALNTRVNRGGYMSVPGTPASEGRAGTSKPESSKSHDGVTLDMSMGSFSERDPLSEAGITRAPGNSQNFRPRVLGTSGVSPQNVRPGIMFQGLFSKSHEPMPKGFPAPSMPPPSFASPGMMPPEILPSRSTYRSIGEGVAHPSGISPVPSLPVGLRPPSTGKPSLGNLALKLSSSRQFTPRPNVPRQQNSEVTKSSVSDVEGQSRSRNIASGRRKGYISVSRPQGPEKVKTSKVQATNEPNSIPLGNPGDFESLSSRDIFSDILKGTPTTAPGMSNSPLNCPPSVTSDSIANKCSDFPGGKLCTQAESDKDPYQKTSALNVRGGIVKGRSNYLQTTGRISKRAGHASTDASLPENGEKNEVYLPQSKGNQSSSSKSRGKSSYLPTVSKSLQLSLQPSLQPSPQEEREGEVCGHETADISQFAHTSIEDLFGSFAVQERAETGDIKRPQEVHINESANQDSSSNSHVTITSTQPNLLPVTAAETILDNKVNALLDMGNTEPVLGVTFDNRDPFAELASSQADLHKKSPPEIKHNGDKESSIKLQLDERSVVFCVNQGEILSNPSNKAILVTSYSNAPERAEQQGHWNDTTPLAEEQHRSSEISSGGPPGRENDENPSPPREPLKASRKVSDIGIEYAQVTIQDAPQSTSYEEPLLGAVADTETVPELPEQELLIEPVTDDGNNTTVVDPFNMPAAEESIQKLDSSRSESHGKSGKKVSETFEESMKSHLIPFDYLTLNDRILGQGAFGVVKKAKLTRPGYGHHKNPPPLDVAVKCLKEGASEIYKNSFKQEAINLMKLENKFIVKFLGVSYNERNNLLLVTELVPQGSLDKYLRDSKNLKILGNEVLLQFAIQITMGMEYLELKKLVHRDLAARNILVATESHVKISDFGLSRIYDDDYYRSQRENQRLPVRWLAPECLEEKKFTVLSDVWSLGVTLWEMFSYGKRPYDDQNFTTASELIRFLKSGKQLERPPACPEDVYVHIKECWHLKPVQRISFFLLKTYMEDILNEKYGKKPYFM